MSSPFRSASVIHLEQSILDSTIIRELIEIDVHLLEALPIRHQPHIKI